MGSVSDLFATATPTPNVIPISDGSATLNAWVTGFMTNPMTNWQDMIVGGLLGTPERLAVGSSGYVLTVGSSGEIGWAAATGGFSNPMTAAEDIIVGGVAGAPTRLARGYVGQVLTVGSGGYLDWETGFTNPMTAAEDLIVGGVGGAPSRLPHGYVGQVLTVGSGGYLDWETPSPGFTNPMTSAEDIIVGGLAGLPSRLPVGYVGQVLTVGSGGYLDWEWANGIVDWTRPGTIGSNTRNTGDFTTLTANGVVTFNRNSGSLTAGPATTIFQLGGADSTNPRIVMDAFAGIPILVGRRANTSNAAKSHVSSGDQLFSIGAFGYRTTAYSTGGGGYINWTASEDWTDTRIGTNLNFGLCPIGSTTQDTTYTYTSEGVLTLSTAASPNSSVHTPATGLAITGRFTTGAVAGLTGAVLMKGLTSGVVTLSVNDVAGTWTMKLPATAGSSGYLLSTDGAGVCAWSAPTGAGDFLALQVFF